MGELNQIRRIAEDVYHVVNDVTITDVTTRRTGFGIIGGIQLKQYCFGTENDQFVEAWTTWHLHHPVRDGYSTTYAAARNLLAAGVPQAVAMKITGQKTDSMFCRYAIVTDAQQREALHKAETYRREAALAQKVTSIAAIN